MPKILPDKVLEDLDRLRIGIVVLRDENERLREDLTLARTTVESQAAQVMRLGQCENCGELDEQDGVRRGGKFYCCGEEATRTTDGEL